MVHKIPCRYAAAYVCLLYTSPDLEAALEELKGKIENDVFMEWVDALKSCLYDRSLKTTLTPIVAKLSDMRIVNAEPVSYTHLLLAGTVVAARKKKYTETSR